MNISTARIAALAASLVLFAGLSAHGQTSVTLTGVNGSSSAGDLCSTQSGCAQVYTGQYYATVNNVANTPIICDDFNHNVSIGETWQATAINTSQLNSSNITGLEFGGLANAPQVYAEVADLVSEIFTLNNGSGAFGGLSGVTGTDLSEAIWDITTKGGITGISNNAAALVKYVQNLFGGDSSKQALSYLNSLNLRILTPSPNNGPQEMWSMSVPEGGAMLMYLLLATLFCGWSFLLRNRERART